MNSIPHSFDKTCDSHLQFGPQNCPLHLTASRILLFHFLFSFFAPHKFCHLQQSVGQQQISLGDCVHLSNNCIDIKKQKSYSLSKNIKQIKIHKANNKFYQFFFLPLFFFNFSCSCLSRSCMASVLFFCCSSFVSFKPSSFQGEEISLARLSSICPLAILAELLSMLMKWHKNTSNMYGRKLT